MYAVIEMMSSVPSVIPMIASVESFDLVLEGGGDGVVVALCNVGYRCIYKLCQKGYL